jgi:hypothetical protein
MANRRALLLLLTAGAVTLSACTPSGGSEQEESPVGSGDSTVQDVGDTECLVGKWSMDVQLYAEDALRTQLSGAPVYDPIGGGSRVLIFEESGNFDFESVDFTLTYTIAVDDITITATTTTNEHYSGTWGWAGDSETDELEFGDVGDVSDPSVTVTDPSGAPLPGVDPAPTPAITEGIPTRTICDGDTLQIDGPVPSVWVRAD